ncbi:MAG: hypothetical protein ABI435_02290 [Pseudolysinimonas sp.]
MSLPDVLILEPAGEHCWRICDTRFEAGLGRFLAVIDEQDGRFAVMQTALGFVWTTFPTIADAVSHVVRTSARQAHGDSVAERS